MLKYVNAVLLVVAVILTGQLYREFTRIDAADYQSEVAVSEPIHVETEFMINENGEEQIVEEGVEVPGQFNLAVEFHPQAPFGDWGEPYQESCEESSLLLAYHYVAGISVSRARFDELLIEMTDWETQRFGKYKDTSLEEVAVIAREYLGHNAFEIVENPTAQQMREFLSLGYPIVAPMSGQDLGNPFFSNEGPVFHALVIRGFENGGFITNDVGTQHGENFVYPEEVLMNALHDWDDSFKKTREHMVQGPKKIMVLKPSA